jgi:hypothetical protein
MALAEPPGVELRKLASDIVRQTLEAETTTPEIERLLVAGAVVVREGEHFRIESGDDAWAELEARAKRLEGLCDCGAVLSARGARAHCRSCGREYRA